MPFTTSNAAEAGRKGGKASGRWKEKNPSAVRTVYLPLRVSSDELGMINEKADKMGLSRVEMVIRAVEGYEP